MYTFTTKHPKTKDLQKMRPTLKGKKVRAYFIVSGKNKLLKYFNNCSFPEGRC